MNPVQRARLAAIVLLLAVTSGCGTAAPSASAARTAGTYDESAAGLCRAFDSLFRAVGNPDTGSGSELSEALDAAVERRDVPAAERAAAMIVEELERGRQHAAAAASFGPARELAASVYRLFVAYVAWTEAKVAQARATPGAPDPQAAFERAGGVEAWTSMLQAMQPLASHRPSGPPRQCPTVPVSL